MSDIRTKADPSSSSSSSSDRNEMKKTNNNNINIHNVPTLDHGDAGSGGVGGAGRGGRGGGVGPPPSRVLHRTTTEYYGDVSRALLPGPPRWMNDWMKKHQRPARLLQKRTSSVYQMTQNDHHNHNAYRNKEDGSRSTTTTRNNEQQQQEDGRERFTSQHHNTYVWPIHDIWVNEFLLWVLPTHMLTHLIKFTVVLVMLLFGFLFGTWYPSSTYFHHSSSDESSYTTTITTPDSDDSDETNQHSFPTSKGGGSYYYFFLLLLYQYWPNLLATLCFIMIPIWVYWYYHTTLYAIGKPWMDPRLPSVNRLDMHVPLRLYPSVQTARQGACHMELVSRNTFITSTSTSTLTSMTSSSPSLAPNIWNLDHLPWKFQLLPTVEKALTVVYDDDLFFHEDSTTTTAHFQTHNDTTTNNNNNNDKEEEDEKKKKKKAVVVDPWSDMVVPSNWMFHNGQVPFDKPIYTNQKYPFPCIPPIVPRNNPTGIYRTVLSLPDEWLELDEEEEALTTLNNSSSSWSRRRSCSGNNEVEPSETIPHEEDIMMSSSSSSPLEITTATSNSTTYTLLLHGIESACFVYWNGELIGFCKDSRLPSEFEIPHHHFVGGGGGGGSQHHHHHHPISHILHLVVARWSDGSYVEDQDHWWMAGVHRSIELVRRPSKADILDFQVLQATAEGQLELRVVTRNRQQQQQEQQQGGGSGGENVQQRSKQRKEKSSPQRSITVRLFQDEQQLPEDHKKRTDRSTTSSEGSASACWKPAKSEMWSATQIIPNQEDKDDMTSTTTTGPSSRNTTTLYFETTIDNPVLWTAETPNLYTLVIEQQEEEEEVIQQPQDDTTISPTASTNTPSSPTRRKTTTTTTQVESCRIGFRSVEITKEDILQVNGKRITICGINRHEHDPDHGKVVSLERMKQDIVTLKKNNFNSIRCSHYPAHTSFYRLCDYYGMYVCDEANIETHGLKPMGRLAHDWGWENTFVSRVCRMVQRDFNHPCIILWSLGNEAGRGRNLSLARSLVLDLDDTRPICYESGGSWAEGVGRTELTDVICCMYPDVNRTIRLAQREDEDRPVILCEYSHSMNNSNGNIHLYWDAFWCPDTPRLQGGFIWDYLDQGLRKQTEQGIEYFAYGGDFGDSINDAQFCINGMFTPDREPHPCVAEIKYLQQPVGIVSKQSGGQHDISLDVSGTKVEPVQLKVINRYAFLDLSHIHFKWSLVCDRSSATILTGTATTETELSKLDFSDALDKICKLEALRTTQFDCAYFLNIQGFLAESQSWSEAGHTLISKQFSVRFDFGLEQPSPENENSRSIIDFGPLQMSDDNDHIEVLRSSSSTTTTTIPMVTISKVTGSIVSVDWDGSGCNILCGDSGVKPNYTRAATDNDRGGMELVLDHMNIQWTQSLYQMINGMKDFSHALVWNLLGLSQDTPPKVVCDSVVVVPSEGGSSDQITITSHCRIVSFHRNTTLMEQVIIYTIYRDGSIRISNRVIPRPSIKKIPSLPRVGISFLLDPAFSHIQYFGRGPEENYPDRKSGSYKGIWNARPSGLGYDYIVPSENGNRSDCEWVAFQRSSSPAGEVLESETGKTNTTPSHSSTGVVVAAEPGSNFNFSALLHSANELHHALHTCDLDRRDDGIHPVYVNIDHKLMGLAGDVSWFPCVYPEFLVPAQEYNYSIWLLPLSTGDDAPIISRRIRS